MIDIAPIQEFLRSRQLFGNTLEQYATALLIFLAYYIGLGIVKAVILARLKHLASKTENNFDDAVIDALLAIKWPFFLLISLMAAIKYVSVLHWLDLTTFYLTLLVITYYAVKVVKIIIVHGARILNKRKESPDEEQDDTIAIVIATIIQVLIWAGVLLYALSVAGVDVTAALAGVGIGGIAIAFALQNVLADIFASFSIYFDKPFKKGDFIQVGTDSGTVEKIGIKSTRLRTLQGQELVVSNKELTEARVNNFKKLERRRGVFTIGVTYDTPSSKLKKIPKIVEGIYKKIDNCDLDRVHFKLFGPSSLDFEIVYFVNAPDYKIYMDIQQKVNFALKDAFEKEKIEFAFPTQTIHVESLPKKRK